MKAENVLAAGNAPRQKSGAVLDLGRDGGGIAPFLLESAPVA